MISAMLAAIPAPPEELVVAALSLICTIVFCYFVWVAVFWLESKSPEVRKRVLVSLVVVALSASLVVMLWAALANAGVRTLTFTLPATTATESSCSGGPPIRSLSGWRIFAQVQSRTWLDNRARMEADPTEWARLWPSVRAEASARQVRSASTKHLPNFGAGARVTVDVPDSLDGMPVLGWRVVTFNDSLQVSCESNWRPGR